MPNKKIVIILSFLILLFSTLFAAYYYLTHYPRLNAYHVTIDAKKLTDIQGGLSGLTWNPDTKTLFSVTDDPSSIIEISPEGTVLRTIKTDRSADLEAIEYMGDNRYFLSKEKLGELALVTINSQTKMLNISQAETYKPDIAAGKKNSGLEGLAWKADLEKMVTAQEKKPVRLYNILQNDETFRTHKSSLNDLMLSWYVKDISGMDFDSSTNNLYILSHESKTVIQVDGEHNLKFMPLTAGNSGLKDNIPQPEGIASDDAGNLYIVSEPNLFYKFSLR